MIRRPGHRHTPAGITSRRRQAASALNRTANPTIGLTYLHDPRTENNTRIPLFPFRRSSPRRALCGRYWDLPQAPRYAIIWKWQGAGRSTYKLQALSGMSPSRRVVLVRVSFTYCHRASSSLTGLSVCRVGVGNAALQVVLVTGEGPHVRPLLLYLPSSSILAGPYTAYTSSLRSPSRCGLWRCRVVVYACTAPTPVPTPRSARAHPDTGFRIFAGALGDHCSRLGAPRHEVRTPLMAVAGVGYDVGGKNMPTPQPDVLLGGLRPLMRNFQRAICDAGSLRG